MMAHDESATDCESLARNAGAFNWRRLGKQVLDRTTDAESVRETLAAELETGSRS